MSADGSPSQSLDFADEMKQLAHQAQTKAGGTSSKTERVEMLQAVASLVKPLALELESVKRGNSELALMLTAMSKLLNTPPAAPAMPPVLEGIVQQLQRMGSVETANQKLFDAMYGELKGYKDGFLFDALQKPFIRDLASLFDDFTAVHEQLEARLKALRATQPTGSEEMTFLQTQAGNMENQIHHLIEVFLRLEVELTRTPVGAPVDKRTHRIVAFAPAATEAEDGQVARSTKPGFNWRERSIRSEEIIAWRWKAGPVAPVPAPDPAPPGTPALPPAA